MYWDWVDLPVMDLPEEQEDFLRMVVVLGTDTPVVASKLNASEALMNFRNTFVAHKESISMMEAVRNRGIGI